MTNEDKILQKLDQLAKSIPTAAQITLLIHEQLQTLSKEERKYLDERFILERRHTAAAIAEAIEEIIIPALDELGERLDRLDTRISRVDDRLSPLVTEVSAIAAELVRLRQRVEALATQEHEDVEFALKRLKAHEKRVKELELALAK